MFTSISTRLWKDTVPLLDMSIIGMYEPGDTITFDNWATLHVCLLDDIIST